MERAELIRRLLQLAAEEHSCLVDEAFDEAEEVRETYDVYFEELRASAERSPFSNDDLMMLQRLHSQTARNIQAARALQRKAQSALAEMAQSRKVMGYSPLGGNHEKAPRYLDQSA